MQATNNSEVRRLDGRIAVVLGTRPEIIEVAAIVRLLGDEGFPIHTGKHFDKNLSSVFFTEFGMRVPDHFLDVGGSSRAEQAGNATTQLEDSLSELPSPYGDLNSPKLIAEAIMGVSGET